MSIILESSFNYDGFILKCFGIENLEALPTTEEDDEEMDEFFSNLVNQKEIQMSKEQERLQKR